LIIIQLKKLSPNWERFDGMTPKEAKKRRREIAALPENRKKKAKYAKKYKQRSYVREKRNEYSNRPETRARKYKAQRKKKREARRLLGGKCFVCGTNRRLEFHHIKYARSSKRNWNEVEVLKHPERFRLLCHKCHNVATYALPLLEPERTILVLTNLHKIIKESKSVLE